MFILDTNVVSELMRERPHSDVLAWLDEQLTSALFVTAITEAEIRTGIALLPDGERKRGLAAAAERAFGVLFAERILPFDSDAGPGLRRNSRHTPCCWPPDQSSRLPDRGGRPLHRGIGRNEKRKRLRRLWDQGDQPLVQRTNIILREP